MALFFQEEASYRFMPYQQHGDNCAFDLPLTQEADREAWDAAKKMDTLHESPNDLPLAAWRADVDQPAFEIVELGNRMASEFKAMETAAYRRDTIEMENIMHRIELQFRAVERLVQLQKRAMESAKANE